MGPCLAVVLIVVAKYLDKVSRRWGWARMRQDAMDGACGTCHACYFYCIVGSILDEVGDR